MKKKLTKINQVDLISGLDQRRTEFVVSKLGDYQYCGDLGFFDEGYKEDDSDLESSPSVERHHFLTCMVVEMVEVNYMRGLFIVCISFY